MYFLENENRNWEKYEDVLKDICFLSKLFSDSKTPYLHYRVHENIFCRVYGAENISRKDCSIDAKKENIGIGLKTFLNDNGATFQKIAEFNKDRKNYFNLTLKNETAEHLALTISELRNKRIEFTKRNYAVDEVIYHCVTREENGLKIFEEKMELIEIEDIRIKKVDEKIVTFTDGKNDYNFNIGKSTLFKRFITQNYSQVKVEIAEDPYEMIRGMGERPKKSSSYRYEREESIVLPLYSTRTNSVSAKSGLNQWNAGGRKRDMDEVYIPISSIIRKKCGDFFPDKDTPFELHLPNNKILNVKICQEGGKALMSNPNTALGQWILRDVFNLKNGELLTDKLLEEIGIDSVEIRKTEDEKYYIDFKKTGTYREFESFLEGKIFLEDEIKESE